MAGFNVSFCVSLCVSLCGSGHVGNSNCSARGSLAPLPSTIDLQEIARKDAKGSELFFVRVQVTMMHFILQLMGFMQNDEFHAKIVELQAHVRSRYPDNHIVIKTIDRASKHNWRLTVAPTANASIAQMTKELSEGANLRATEQVSTLPQAICSKQHLTDGI